MPEKGRVLAIYRGKWVAVGVRREVLQMFYRFQTGLLDPVTILRDLF